MDPGACRVGEFSLTDRRFSRITRFMADTLYDENFGGRYGNCHIALGSSYSNAYSGDPRALTRPNRRALGFNESALHWDLVNTENKTVRVTTGGGKTITIYDKGIFLY
jgi:aminopeptidase